jgi:CheY-like chemotaxis protein
MNDPHEADMILTTTTTTTTARWRTRAPSAHRGAPPRRPAGPLDVGAPCPGRVLLVDGDPTSARATAAIVRAAGFVCDVVDGGGAELFSLSRRAERYDVVLVDCVDPRAQAFTAAVGCLHVHRRRRPHDSPLVVALTPAGASWALPGRRPPRVDFVAQKPLSRERLAFWMPRTRASGG